MILIEGSVAEWSKALVLGTSPKGRGFESHRCQIFYWNLLKGSWRHRGSNPGHLACEASALPLSYIPYSWLQPECHNCSTHDMGKLGRVV